MPPSLEMTIIGPHNYYFRVKVSLYKIDSTFWHGDMPWLELNLEQTDLEG